MAKMHWRSHWVLPSPTQLYEMVRRLRPDGGPNGGPRDPSGEVVNLQDVLETLQYNDYAPLWTQKLTAVSYRPVTRVDIRRLHFHDIIDKSEMIEYYKDAGWIDRDAKRLADFTVIANDKTKEREEERKLRPMRNAARKHCLAMYRTGIIDEPEARQCLADTKLEPVEVVTMLQHVDIDMELKLVRATIARIKNEYAEGAIDIVAARDALTRLGITERRREQLLFYWSADRSVDTRVMQTAKVLDLAERQIMPPPETINRLRNLGWTEPDVMYHMRAVEQDLDIKAAQAAEKAARTEAAKIRAKMAEIKAIEAKLRQARRDLMSHSSPAMMRRWLQSDFIGVGEVIERLKFLGWPDDDAERWLDESGHGQKNNGENGSGNGQA